MWSKPKNNFSHNPPSYNLKTEVTYLTWKTNRKEHAEETLYNLSSDNVYLLFDSFCRFHETFGLN